MPFTSDRPWHDLIMKTTHTFLLEEHAREFSRMFNAWGAKRNNGATISFREGRVVTLRPEYTSSDTLREFSLLIEALE